MSSISDAERQGRGSGRWQLRQAHAVLGGSILSFVLGLVTLWAGIKFKPESPVVLAIVHEAVASGIEADVAPLRRELDDARRENRRLQNALDEANKKNGEVNHVNGGGDEPIQIPWDWTADEQRHNLDQEFSFRCPPNGKIQPLIYGTDRYTYDSSICTSAVHAGKIRTATGGDVTIKMIGPSIYAGSLRNGVESRRAQSNKWEGYIFVDH
jgi:hypothetical protein